MAKNSTNPFLAKNVCKPLVKDGLISQDNAKFFIKNEASLIAKFEKKHEKKDNLSLTARIYSPTTIIDIIASRNLPRIDSRPGYIDEEAIYQSLARAWGFEYKKVDPLKLDLNVATSTIPFSFAMKYLILPISVQDGVLTVTTSNPFNLEALDDVSRAGNIRVNTVVSAKKDIKKLINEFFGFKKSIAAAENQFAGPGLDLGNLEQYVKLRAEDELPQNDQHIVNAVSHIFSSAFDQRASDVHIEPKREETLVRMRIDGVLHTVYKLPKSVHNAIVSRIKALSRLDMAEKRRPQDGRIKTDKAGVEVEIRISTIPVAFGEKIVMRVMDPEILFQDLEKLGFTKPDFERYETFVKRPHGVILVTGPTGSGKSTTLYSSLRSLYTPELNITTVEDPIEMVHEDFNQIAVNPTVGITFANVLRNILRQDPDIIMIGEMRDLETAHNAIQAALTGHLVLSTLHTNDAPSAITRLLDLGIPPFLMQATLVGILGQRLVRKICEYCREPFEIKATELTRMGLETDKKGNVTLHRGKGCLKCRGTGHLGRIAAFEVMPYSETIKKLTTAQADIQEIRKTAINEGMTTLRENAILAMLQGATTHHEVARVTWASD